MMNYIGLAILALAVPSVPAWAAPFNGVSVGVHGGAVERSGSLRVGNARLAGSKTIMAYGAFIGVDVPISRLVVGAQAEINGGGANLLTDDGAGTVNTVDPKWGYAVSARAGILATPSLLVYGRLGYAAERTREEFGGPIIYIVPIPPKSHWDGGLQIGGGAEFAATRKISVRAEYRHNDYSKRYEANQFLVGAAFHF